MRLAVVQNDLVINVIVADTVLSGTVASDTANIGDTYNGTIFTPAQKTLEAARVFQTNLLNTACQTAITSGFASNALGSEYFYPSQMTDQQNLSANVLSSVLPGLPSTWTTLQLCQSQSTGVWNYIAHTSTQIQQVGTDAKSAILAALVHNATQKAAVAAATTVSAVQAIVW